MSIQEIVAAVREQMTPERIKSLAKEGNAQLQSIARYEDFTAAAIKVRDKVIRRDADYEVVRFTDTARPEDVVGRCERAVREIGRRLESCLNGKPAAKTHPDAPVTAGGVDPEGACLFSLGPVPRLIDSDGLIAVTRDSRTWHIRFGYYAQTGPLGFVKEPEQTEEAVQ
jgi:hypothetical protein